MKVIQTVYKGHRFRSRLEARWAVFFDALGIEYRYEPEGFDLDGVWYLPDFYLPKQQCWVEIKGGEPTDEESQKAKLLALYSNKYVYIFYGDIRPPNENKGTRAFAYNPPALISQMGEECAKEIAVPTEIMLIFQKLHEANLELGIEEDVALILKAKEKAIFITRNDMESEDDIETLASIVQMQQATIRELAPLLRKYKHDILTLLVPQEGWTTFFVESSKMPLYIWQECSRCSDLDIRFKVFLRELDDEKFYTHRNCPYERKGAYTVDTPRLREAYIAARQARFEHGESPNGR